MIDNNAGNPVAKAAEWAASGASFALATVTKTWGSAPRVVGSLMVVRSDGAFAGSVSGGCVETAVIAEAQDAIADGKARQLSYGVSNDDAWAVGLACGGTIEVHVTPILSASARHLIGELAAAEKNQRRAVLATDLKSGETRLLLVDETNAAPLAEVARDAATRDTSASVDADGRSWFLNVFNPPIDLVVIGAVHIAQPLAAMAKLAGHAVRVIDPRQQFATEERFPGVRLVHSWPDEALNTAPLTARSAVIALTHDPKLDDPALVAALRSTAFYVGALGSKQTHARRLERLAASGFSADQLSRIKGPIGLNIGARSPAEIGIAILAEITKSLRMP